MWWLLGCTGPALVDSVAVEQGLTALDPVRLARRTSLDTRGVLPSVHELEQVRVDPAALDALRTAWLQDPRAEAHLVRLLGQRWHTLTDTMPLGPLDYGLDPDGTYGFVRSVGQEPLRLVVRTVLEGAPYADVVTSPRTVADDTLLAVWPLQADDAETEWRWASYTDGRPAAGVLATNGLWWRYSSTQFNYNRTRANTVSRLLLCTDMLSAPVALNSPSLFDEDGTADAISTDPACVNCHVALDPVAASFFGFWWYDLYDTAELTYYHPEREPLNRRYLGVQPGWYGQPIGGLVDLGAAVAADPRFERCAVQTWAELMWRRPLGVDDQDALEALLEQLRDQDGRMLPVLEQILASAEYAAGDADDPAVATTRLLTPEQLSSAVAEQTGFEWTWRSRDRMLEDTEGFRVMAGGVDGAYVTTPSDRVSVGGALVAEQLASAAAWWAVDQARADAPPPLLEGLDVGVAPDAHAIEQVWWRLTGRPVQPAVAGDLLALCDAVDAQLGPRQAWVVLVTAVLRDPEFLTL